MSKGRKVPDPPTDHAANLRERLGKVAYEAAFDHVPSPWEEIVEARRERYRTIGQAVMDAIVRKASRRQGQIGVASSYGAATHQPYVELTIDVSPAPLPGLRRARPGQPHDFVLLPDACPRLALLL